MKVLARSDDVRVFGFGLIWSTLGTVVLRLTPVITTILISHWFGIESVGTFAITYSTMMSSTHLAAGGVSIMTTRNIAASATTDPDAAGRLAGMAMLLVGGVGTALSLAIFFLSDVIATRVLKQPELGYYLQVVAPIIFLGSLRQVMTAVLTGLQEFKTVARLNIVVGVLMIVSVPVGLYLQGLTGGFVALGLVNLVGCAVTAPAMLRDLRARNLHILFRGSLSEWPMITRYAIPALLASLLYEPVNWICTSIIVNNPDGLKQVGVYFIVMQLETLLLFAPQIVVQVLIPMLSTGFGENDRRRVLKVLAMSIATNVAIAIGFVVVTMLFGQWFLLLFKLDPARDWTVFMIVVLASAMIACTLPLGQVPVSSGYMWTGLSITGVWAILFILGTWLLRSHGTEGIVIARAFAWSFLFVTYIAFTIFAVRGLSSGNRWPPDDRREENERDMGLRSNGLDRELAD